MKQINQEQDPQGSIISKADGILLINKPKGVSSNYIVQAVKKKSA